MYDTMQTQFKQLEAAITNSEVRSQPSVCCIPLWRRASGVVWRLLTTARSSKLGRYLQAQQEIKQMLASQQSERANFFQTFAALQDTNNYLELNKLKR
jgi:hypothetical protein